MYGMPGAVSPNTMMYGQMGQPSPSNFPYRTVRGYMIPGPSMLQYGRPIVCGVTTEVIPSMHSPNHPGKLLIEKLQPHLHLELDY